MTESPQNLDKKLEDEEKNTQAHGIKIMSIVNNTNETCVTDVQEESVCDHDGVKLKTCSVCNNNSFQFTVNTQSDLKHLKFNKSSRKIKFTSHILPVQSGEKRFIL